jgi:hypothetical protein
MNPTATTSTSTAFASAKRRISTPTTAPDRPSGHFLFPNSRNQKKTSTNARSYRYRLSQENLAETLFDPLHIRTIVFIQTRKIHFTRFIGVECTVHAERREHQDAIGAPIHRAMFGSIRYCMKCWSYADTWVFYAPPGTLTRDNYHLAPRPCQNTSRKNAPTHG